MPPILQPTILPDENLSFPTQVDSSMLSTFDACPIKFFREYVEHWSPSAKSVDLHAGGAFAHGIEAVRKGLWADGLSLEDALTYGMREFTQFWGDYEPPEKHPKTYGNMLLALHDYFDHYNPQFDPLKPYIMQDGRPAIEFKFALPTDIIHPESGDPILYCGRFDLLGYFHEVLCVVDEKTSRYTPNSQTLEAYHMRGQFLGYVWAAQQHGFPVEHALVRVVVILMREFKQLQNPVPIPNWQLERWYENMNDKVSHMVEYWKRGRWPYSYGDACSSYSGCPYMTLCTSAKPENWIGDYTKRYWNPVAKNPTAPPEEEELWTVL